MKLKTMDVSFLLWILARLVRAWHPVDMKTDYSLQAWLIRRHVAVIKCLWAVWPQRAAVFHCEIICFCAPQTPSLRTFYPLKILSYSSINEGLWECIGCHTTFMHLAALFFTLHCITFDPLGSNPWPRHFQCHAVTTDPQEKSTTETEISFSFLQEC